VKLEVNSDLDLEKQIKMQLFTWNITRVEASSLALKVSLTYPELF